MRILNSIKFKLTAGYSLIVLLFCALFIVSFNLLLSQYLQRGPIPSDRIPPKYISDFTQRDVNLIRESRKADFEKIQTFSWYSLVPLTVLSFLSGYLIADYMLSPINRLRKEVESLEVSSLGKQISIKDKGDEISSLVESFNNMSIRIRDAYVLQKEFVENASHELKTPLTSIKANIELLDSDIKLTQKQKLELIHSTLDSINYLNTLSNELLLLSSVNNRIIEKHNVNLHSFLHRLISEYSSSGFEFELKVDSKYMLNVNEVLLKRAIGNIIENSIKHSKGSKIVIEVHKKEKQTQISVIDDGVGIEHDKVAHIFDRFYKIDKSRANRKGFGLGLSISKDIIQAHNGIIRVDSEYSKGTKFDIVL